MDTNNIPNYLDPTNSLDIQAPGFNSFSKVSNVPLPSFNGFGGSSNGFLDFFKNFNFSDKFQLLISILTVVFSILIIFFVSMIFYCTIRVFEIRKKEHLFLEHEIEEYAHKHKKIEEEKLKIGGEGVLKWQKILQHLSSQNENDWRLAILEADTMLFEAMEINGFLGESLGEKLKSTTSDHFKDLKIAWEAHYVRNKIAHEGSEFHISLPDTKRVIFLYDKVLRGLNYI